MFHFIWGGRWAFLVCGALCPCRGALGTDLPCSLCCPLFFLLLSCLSCWRMMSFSLSHRVRVLEASIQWGGFLEVELRSWVPPGRNYSTVVLPQWWDGDLLRKQSPCCVWSSGCFTRDTPSHLFTSSHSQPLLAAWHSLACLALRQGWPLISNFLLSRIAG